jgi:Tol biopolymer transport system component
MRQAFVVIAVTACGGATPLAPPAPPIATPPPPPPYAAPGPLTTPRLFGTGAISTADPEFAIAFASDGATAYFDRATPDRSKFSIVASSFAHGVWQPAQPLPFSTGEFRDADPFVAGDRLYFSSNRPHPGTAATDFDTWYVDRHGSTWGEPVHLEGAASGPANELCVSIAGDGTLYFQSDASGGGDIYRAPRVAGGYPSAAPVGAVDTPESEGNPAISPDGTLLIFVSPRSGGAGGPDLWGSRFRDGSWSAPKPLAVANSAQADFAPGFSPDGRYLFFTSERPGVVPAPTTGRPPGDIYQIDVAALGL